jgi:LysR family glycine cleavage system transcriptional activator
VGRQYAAQITPLLDRIAAATEQISQTPKGTVVLSVEPTFAQKWLVPRLADFYERYPEIDLELRSSAEVVDVAAHAADIALRYCQHESDTTDLDLVSDRPFSPYAAPGLLEFDGKNVPPEILAQKRLIGYYLTNLWPQWFATAGLRDLPPLNMTKHMPALLMIEYSVAGQGVLLLSSEMVEQELQSGKLVQLSDVGVKCGGYYLVINEAAGRRKAVRAFRDWVLSVSKSLRTQEQ